MPVRVFPLNASDEELLAFVWEWVDLIAAGRTAEAWELLHQEGEAFEVYTVEMLHHFVSDAEWRMTPVADTAPAAVPPLRWLSRGGSAELGEIHVALPLNGVWSDLTAKFALRPWGEGMALGLYSLEIA